MKKIEDQGDELDQETRRLPGRFSRIDKSDSESEEDDRLDEYADEEEGDNHEEKEMSETVGTREEDEEIEENELENHQEGIEEEADNILDEILRTTANEEDNAAEDDLLGSDDEFDLYGDNSDKTKSPQRGSSSELKKSSLEPLPKKEFNEKNVLSSVVVQRTVSLAPPEPEVSKPEPDKSTRRRVIIAPPSPPNKKIKLRVPSDEDPAERRRRKFGLPTPDKDVMNSRKTEEDLKEGNSRKMRSCVVRR
jgi:hypothetical protein